MEFLAKIDVMPKKEILDPQGKAVKLGLHNLGLKEANEVRVGKHITLKIDAENEKDAEDKATFACKNLLANLIMENYDFTIENITMADAG